ncbi:MAG: M28 family peptidase [Thermoplasmata archaeon]|nr:MAG: M28 family peptidase [Thermoplasmata archaeon]
MNSYVFQSSKVIIPLFYLRCLTPFIIVILIISNIPVPSQGVDDSNKSAVENSTSVLSMHSCYSNENMRSSTIIWEGVKVVEDDFSVNSGQTLYISPGARLYFKEDVELLIKGTLKVEGNSKAQVRISALDKNKKWNGIRFYESANTLDSYLRHCYISDARTALSFRMGIAELYKLEFSNNEIGLEMYLATGKMNDITYKSNDIAIISDTCAPYIENSTIEQSQVADIILRNSSQVTFDNVSFDVDKVIIDDIYSKLEVFWHLKVTITDLKYPNTYDSHISVYDTFGNKIHSNIIDSSDSSDWLKCKSFLITEKKGEPSKISIQYITSHLVKISRFGVTKSELVYLDENKHITATWSDFGSTLPEFINLIKPESQQVLMRDFVNLGWKHTVREEKVDTLKYLASRMRGLGDFNIAFDNHTHQNYPLDNGLTVDLELSNLVCTLEGTSEVSDEYIVISAHYDTDHNTDVVGADDDGSGVVALLEIARIISGFEFNTTIKFIFFDAEEEGYIGSYDYASSASANNHEIVTDINVDMIGYNQDSGYPCIIRTNTNSLDIAQLFSDMNTELGLGLEVSIVNDPAYRRSDYFNFWDFNYKAINFVEAEEVETCNPFYHTAMDGYDIINFSYLSEMTSLIASGLIELAKVTNSAPTTPLELSPDSTHLLRPTLVWSPSIDVNGDPINYHLKVLYNRQGSSLRADTIVDTVVKINSYIFKSNLSYGQSYSIQLTAVDDKSASSKALNTEMMIYNTPPNMEDISDQYLTQDILWVYQVNASDSDIPEDKLEYYDNSTLFQINHLNGSIQWTPTKFDVGRHLVNFSVVDNNGGFDYRTVLLIVENVNDPPEVIHTPPLISFNEDTELLNAFNLNEIFMDYDGDNLEFNSEDASNINIEIHNNGSVDLGAKDNWSGTEQISFRAEDPFNLNSSVSVDVQVNPVNDAPALLFIPDITLNETESFELNPEALDAENDILYFQYSWPNFTGVWQSDYFSAGIYQLNVTVNDTEKIDWQVVLVIVNNVNRNPIYNSILPEERTLKAGESLSFVADFLDPDDDLDSNGILEGSEQDNQGYFWDFGDGTVLNGKSVEHKYEESGVYQVKLTAVDPDNGSFTVHFNFSVEKDTKSWSREKTILTSGIAGLIFICITIVFILRKKDIIFKKQPGISAEEQLDGKEDEDAKEDSGEQPKPKDKKGQRSTKKSRNQKGNREIN